MLALSPSCIGSYNVTPFDIFSELNSYSGGLYAKHSQKLACPHSLPVSIYSDLVQESIVCLCAPSLPTCPTLSSRMMLQSKSVFSNANEHCVNITASMQHSSGTAANLTLSSD